MADQPDRPDEGPDAATPAREPSTPPVKKTPAARKAAPAKKATPAKKAAAKRAAPAKKATPAKKTPAPEAPPTPAQLAGTNGDLTSAAKEAAAQAKSTVATASTAVSSPPPAQRDDRDWARLPVAAALITGVLAIVAVLYIARRGGSE